MQCGRWHKHEAYRDNLLCAWLPHLPRLFGAAASENFASEPTNLKGRYTVSVVEGGTIVGQLPGETSRVCSLFLPRGGSIVC